MYLFAHFILPSSSSLYEALVQKHDVATVGFSVSSLIRVQCKSLPTAEVQLPPDSDTDYFLSLYLPW